MRMMMMFFVCLLSATTCFAQEGERYFCDAAVPLSSPTDRVAIINNEGHVKTVPSFAVTSITLRNEANSPITEYALLLETFDAQGKRVYGVTFHRFSNDKSVSPYWMPPAIPLARPIEPGEVFAVDSMTPKTSSRCPASATVSYVFLRFASGETLTHASRGWRVDATAAVVTDHLLLGGCSVPDGMGVPAILGVDAEGTVKFFKFRDKSMTQNLSRCLERELRLWRFSPALIEGRATATEINTLLFFNIDPRRWAYWLEQFPREFNEGVFLLWVTPWDSQRERWDFGPKCCIALSKFHP